MSQWFIIQHKEQDHPEAVIQQLHQLQHELLAEAVHVLLVGYAVTTTYRIRQWLSTKISEERIFAITKQDQHYFDDTFTQANALCIERWLEKQGATVVTLPGKQQLSPSDYLQRLYPKGLTNRTPTNTLPHKREKLAFISPLPPEQTGIANYNYKLLPLLTTLYDITLVAQQEQVSNAVKSLPGIYETLSPDQFRHIAHHFDRLVYHFGNSLFHAWQFDLLKQHPGLVVLHDYYLFDAIWWMEHAGILPFGIKRSLYDNHGFPALLEVQPEQHTRGPDHFPVNGAVVHEAAGLVLHSEHARTLHKQWYPDYSEQAVSVLPLYRDIPNINIDKLAIRNHLGINSNTLIIASFGGINAKKGTDQLVKAFLSTQFDDTLDVKLVLIGAQNTDSFGKQLKQLIQSHPAGKHIHITGYTDDTQYNHWLHTADIAVQLRKESRGESSGTLFDVMAYGICAIVNAHGSSAEVPADCVWQLAESITPDALSDALKTLATDAQKRATLGHKGRVWVEQTLNSDTVTRRYYAAIEASVNHPIRHEYRWLDTLAKEIQRSGATEAQIAVLTKQLAPLNLLNRRSPRRLVFDISTLAWNDQKTGIERVTRELAIQLLKTPPPGYRVELIQWRGDTYYTHPSYAAMLLNVSAEGLTSRPIEATAGDIYLTVEWSPPIMEQAQAEMARMRARGVRFYFTVHDLLPVLMPQYFPAGTDKSMQTWFDRVTDIADGIICVSKCVAEDVQALASQHTERILPYIGVFNSGADFSKNSSTLTQDEAQLVQQLNNAATTKLLMVGTLEPRKGHQQVLDAVQQLWQQNNDTALIIVGKQGWDVDALIRTISTHPEKNHRLFWLQGCSDALLQAVYRLSDGLIAASYGEGFGLPLIEAAQCKLPILARDIAVFREVAQHYAIFFTAQTTDEMAAAIKQYVSQIQSGDIADRIPLSYNNWKQSAAQLTGEIMRDPALAAFHLPSPVTETT